MDDGLIQRATKQAIVHVNVQQTIFLYKGKFFHLSLRKSLYH